MEGKQNLFAIPIGSGDRSFAFGIPDNLTTDEARFILVTLEPLLNRAAKDNATDSRGVVADRDVSPSTQSAPLQCSLEDNNEPKTEPLLSDNAVSDNKPDAVSETETIHAKENSNGLPLPAGKWSRDYDKCINPDCRHPEAKHEAGGLCRPCYGLKWKKDKRAKKRVNPTNSRPLESDRVELDTKARVESIGTLTQPVDETPAPSTNGKRWSLLYDCCRDCGSTERRHMGGGFCKRCYFRGANQEIRNRERSKPVGPKPISRWSHEHDHCKGCETTDNPHVSGGYCRRCYDAVRAGRPFPRPRSDASTNGQTKPVAPAPQLNGAKTATKPTAKPDETTVPTPMRKAPWPLKGVSGFDAVKYCARLRVYWADSKFTLDEIAVREALDLDILRKVFDLFSRDIDNAIIAPNFEESLRKAWERRYES